MAREMKDSGIEWIGEIPADWDIAKVSYFFDIELGKMLQPTPVSPSDTLENYLCAANVGGNRLKLDTIKQMWFSESEKTSLLIEKGDLLVVEGGDIASCDIVEEDIKNTYFQNALHRVRSKVDYDIRILKYYLWTAKSVGYIGLICNKATISHFSKEKFVNLPFVFIPVPEQKKIADFLDSKCTEIDRVLEKTRASIEEYKKLKQSVITQAVTKGIRGEREMKDSGIEWIGEIPKEWSVSRMKYAAILEPTCKTDHLTTDSIITYTPMEYIKNGKYISNTARFGSLSSSLTSYQEGDIVMAKVTPCFENGNIAIMNNLASGYGLGSSELYVFRPKSVNTRYLFYWLQNRRFVQKACATMTGTGGLKRISSSFVKNSPLALPTKEEQIAISAYLDCKCAEIDTLISKKEQLITELEAYKKSLIYEYVTGKKEVIDG